MGKITIVDFWASWCGPCRAENPNMVAIYKEFHDKGLNIIGVSLDKDVEKWNEAIAKDKLSWTQVSHLKYWEEPIAVQYGVKSIPATFILDASRRAPCSATAPCPEYRWSVPRLRNSRRRRRHQRFRSRRR